MINPFIFNHTNGQKIIFIDSSETFPEGQVNGHPLQSGDILIVVGSEPKQYLWNGSEWISPTVQSGGTEMVYNGTGSPLAAGDIVYRNGWNAANSCFTVAKADADAGGTFAELVITEAIANGATGSASTSYEFTGQNTSAAGAVGDPVYLSTTAGGWTLSAPTGSDDAAQIIGRVSVKHASTGKIRFKLPGMIKTFGINELQAAIKTFKETVSFPGTWGKDTDGKNGGWAGCSAAADVTATEASATYCKVYDLSATTFYNLEDTTAGDFTQWKLLPANTQANDYVAFGSANKFAAMWIDMSATNQTYTNDGLTWEYYNGSAWAALTVFDYTDATAQDGKRSFGRDGSITFVPPSDWATTTLGTVSAYWIRAKVVTAANISQLGVTNSKRHYLTKPTQGAVVTRAIIPVAVTLRDFAATVHTGTPKFMICNLTQNTFSGELTVTAARRNVRLTTTTPTFAANDVLAVLITAEDGTNEISDGILEIEGTLA